MPERPPACNDSSLLAPCLPRTARPCVQVDLWKTSGHFDFYRESMFNQMEVEGEDYQARRGVCSCVCITCMCTPCRSGSKRPGLTRLGAVPVWKQPLPPPPPGACPIRLGAASWPEEWQSCVAAAASAPPALPSLHRALLTLHGPPLPLSLPLPACSSSP